MSDVIDVVAKDLTKSVSFTDIEKHIDDLQKQKAELLQTVQQGQMTLVQIEGALQALKYLIQG